jgi:hypothetical protein
MRYGKIRAGSAALAAAGLVATLAGSAFAQTPTTTTPGAPSSTAPAPTTTIAPKPATPQNYFRFPKAKFSDSDTKPKTLAAQQMTKDNTQPTRGYTAPTSIAVDPENPRVIVAAVADLRARTCQLTRSVDAGRTWHFSKAPPSTTSYPFCTSTMAGVPEAMVAFGRNHTLYYGLMAYTIAPGEGPRDGDTSIAVARSTDLGDTWNFTLVTNNRGATGANAATDTGVTGLSVDTSGARDVVYIGFSRSYPNAPSDSPLKDPIPMVATSTDGAQTFAPPVNLNDSVKMTQNVNGKDYRIIMRTGFGAPFIGAHKGTVLAVAGSDFSAIGQDRPTPPPEAGANLTPGTFYAFPLPQLIARSTDQGKTWQVQRLGPNIYAGTGSMTGINWTPKGATNGTWVATYVGTPENSSTTGTADVVTQRSIDDGKTWTAPLAVNDDKPEQHANPFYPNQSEAPNGRIDVVFQDNRDLGDFRFNVMYTYSDDGGVTWAPNVKVTDRPIDFNFGISFNSDIRFPPGVASTNYYAAVGWADTRLATDLTQSQDAFGALAQLKPLPATKNTTAPVIAAIFGGLVAAGVVLLVILLIRRRRESPRRPGVAQPQSSVKAG